MKIAIDLDEILADFMSALILFHNDVYNTKLKKSDFFSYKFWEVWGGTEKEAIQKIYDFHKTSYFHDIKPITGSVDAVNELKKGNDLFVITSRQDDVTRETKQWIKEYFDGIFSQIQFANHYSQNGTPRKKSDFCNDLKIDVLIEDSPDYARECFKAGRKIILFKYPWNVNTKIEGIYLVNNWGEALKTIL